MCYTQNECSKQSIKLDNNWDSFKQLDYVIQLQSCNWAENHLKKTKRSQDKENMLQTTVTHITTHIHSSPFSRSRTHLSISYKPEPSSPFTQMPIATHGLKSEKENPCLCLTTGKIKTYPPPLLCPWMKFQ